MNIRMNMHRMAALGAVILTSIVPGATRALSATEEPLAPAPEVKAKSYDMAYSFSARDSLRYRIWQHFTGTAPASGTAVPQNVDTELTTIAQVWLDRALPKGRLQYAVGTESSQIKVDGATQRRDANPVQYFSGSTQTLGILNMDSGSPASVLLMNTLPPGPAVVGDSWTLDAPVKRSNSILRLRFTLESVADTADGKVATIKYKFTQLSPRADTGDYVPDGSQNGGATVTFNIDKGRLLTVAGNATSNLILTGLDPKRPKAVTKSSIKTEFKAELLNVLDVPPSTEDEEK